MNVVWKRFGVYFSTERWGFQLELFNGSWFSLYLSPLLIPSWRREMKETADEYGWDKPNYTRFSWHYNDLVTDGTLRLRSAYWTTPLVQGDVGLFNDVGKG